MHFCPLPAFWGWMRYGIGMVIGLIVESGIDGYARGLDRHTNQYRTSGIRINSCESLRHPGWLDGGAPVGDPSSSWLERRLNGHLRPYDLSW